MAKKDRNIQSKYKPKKVENDAGHDTVSRHSLDISNSFTENYNDSGKFFAKKYPDNTSEVGDKLLNNNLREKLLNDNLHMCNDYSKSKNSLSLRTCPKLKIDSDMLLDADLEMSKSNLDLRLDNLKRPPIHNSENDKCDSEYFSRFLCPEGKKSDESLVSDTNSTITKKTAVKDYVIEVNDKDLGHQIDEISKGINDMKIARTDAPTVCFHSNDVKNNSKGNQQSEQRQSKVDSTDKNFGIYNTISNTFSRPVSQTWKPPILEIDPDCPHTLDIFQHQAFYLISKQKTVLVTAHTGSGKTAIVEYAIQLAKNHNTRVVYTSPLKALSNQKFYEFKRFSPGIITGDVSINSESDILIMTTEILRNQLYGKNPNFDNLEFVIFDEVHYINNPNRGVVWEECIIGLPPHVTLILLSAVIPNAVGFAEWIGRIRQREVYVISNNTRVVPLEYYICKDYNIIPLFNTIAPDEQTKTPFQNRVAEKNNFRPLDITNFDKFLVDFDSKINSLQKTAKSQPQRSFDRKEIKSFKVVSDTKTNQKDIRNIKEKPFVIKTALMSIFRYVIYKKLTPVIFFCFSKKKCIFFAKMISKQLLNEPEKKTVAKILENLIFSKLTKSDQSIAQIKEIISLIQNGIGVHHSGMLPLLKELVEILFSKKLLKVIFATETFSIGVNFPAKSVVFLGVTKRDSNGLRLLSPSEFLQISGRAGRRSIDKKGVVIVCPDSNTEKNLERILYNLLKNQVVITSKFKLSFNMILDFIAANMKVEDVLRLSFGEDQVQRKIADSVHKYDTLINFVAHKQARISIFEKNTDKYPLDIFYSNSTSGDKRSIDLNSFDSDKISAVQSNLLDYSGFDKTLFYNTNAHVIDTRRAAEDFKSAMHDHEPKYDAAESPEKSTGEDINVYVDACVYCCRFQKYFELKKQIFDVSQCLLGQFFKSFKKFDDFSILTSDGEILTIQSYNEKTIQGNLIRVFSESSKLWKDASLVIKNIMRNFGNKHLIFSIENDHDQYEAVDTKSKKVDLSKVLLLFYKHEIFLDFKPTNYDSMIQLTKYITLHREARSFTQNPCRLFQLHKIQAFEIYLVDLKIKEIEKLLGDESLNMYKDYQDKLSVLKKHEYIRPDNVVLLKGAMAKLIKSSDCILITEMILHNSFLGLTFEFVAAILTSMISTESSETPEENTILPEVQNFWKGTLFNIFHGENVTFNMNDSVICGDFVFSFHSNYVDSVYAWCLDSSLPEITSLYNVELGGFIRLISILDEVCKEIIEVCTLINNTELLDLIQNGRCHFRKNVMQYKSLYYDSFDC